MKQLESTKKKNPYTRHAFVGIKFSPDEVQYLKSMAKKLTKGNMSEFIRYCALNFKAS